jgi:hypothetical protein
MAQTLISMEMSAEEAKEQTQPAPADEPRYPWGLNIHLDDDAVGKLGIGDLKVGSEVTIVAKATVSSCSSYQTQGGEAETSCDLQITDMRINAGSGDARSMYPNSDLD